MPKQTTLFGLLAACMLLISGGLSNAQETENSVPAESSGMNGSMCWAALVELTYQVATRCDLGEDEPSDDALMAYKRARADLAAKFLTSGWDTERLDKFRNEQGGGGVPDEHLCTFGGDPETEGFIRDLAKLDSKVIVENTQAALAVPGKPKWGDCL
ncbi:MAG: hypothetical protein ABJX46_12785 [Erythrobacter sp.]